MSLLLDAAWAALGRSVPAPALPDVTCKGCEPTAPAAEGLCQLQLPGLSLHELQDHRWPGFQAQTLTLDGTIPKGPQLMY